MTVIAIMSSLSDTNFGLKAANSRGTQILTDSSSGSYDSDYTSWAIFVQNSTSEPYLDLKVNKTEFWLHFDFYSTDTGSTPTNVVEFRSQSGTLQAAINLTGSFAFEVSKSTDGTSGTSLSGTSFTLSASTRHALDIHVKLGASGEVALYKDGVLSFTYTGDMTTNGDNAIRYVTFKGFDARNRSFNVSQVIADTGSTVGFKLFTTYPINTNTFTDWSGSWVGKNNTDYNGEAAGTYANVVGHKVSFTGSSLPVASAGLSVRAVVSSARAYASNSATPQSLALGVRFSTTNYEGDTFYLGSGEGVKFCQHVFNQNPQTGIPWTYSEANSVAMTHTAKA